MPTHLVVGGVLLQYRGDGLHEVEQLLEEEDDVGGQLEDGAVARHLLLRRVVAPGRRFNRLSLFLGRFQATFGSGFWAIFLPYQIQ